MAFPPLALLQVGVRRFELGDINPATGRRPVHTK